MDENQRTETHGLGPRITPPSYAQRAAAMPPEHPMFDIYSALALREQTQMPLVDLEVVPIKASERYKVFFRARIGSRTWNLHCDQWLHLHLGIERVPRARTSAEEDYNAPYADVTTINFLVPGPWPSVRSPGFAFAKYTNQLIFSVAFLPPRELAEVASQFGITVGPNEPTPVAIARLFSSPAFKALSHNVRELKRPLNAGPDPYIGDWYKRALGQK